MAKNYLLRIAVLFFFSASIIAQEDPELLK